MISSYTNNIMENLDPKHGLVSRTYYKKSLIMASTFGSKSKFLMTMPIPSQDEPLTNRPVVSFVTKTPKNPGTSDCRLIELENQVQLLMEAYLAPTQPTQVNKITTLCEICLLNMHPRIPMKREVNAILSSPSKTFLVTPIIHHGEVTLTLEGLVSNFMASQDARLSKFKADFKQQQSEMTNKIDTVLKAITDQIAGTLPSDTVKNPKLSTSLVLSAPSYPKIDRSTAILPPPNTINGNQGHILEAKHSQTTHQPAINQDKDRNIITGRTQTNS
ncbi:hypothetical protein Tco_0893915 [Tanacetum coccineum]|uniref:Uncharacterized protein n=1 Tax=Tanacetum coccineum TaxID=301880 RepID=A0ABQ5CBJ4_9ASTR